MTEPRFIIKEGEHGPEYWEGDDKLAFINETGNLQSTRGNADRKHEITDFIDWHAAHDPAEPISDGPDGGQGEPDTGGLPQAEGGEADFAPHETKDAGIDEVTPVCPVAEDPSLGDKTPAIVAWWFKNHPKIAEKKYTGRRYQKP